MSSKEASNSKKKKYIKRSSNGWMVWNSALLFLFGTMAAITIFLMYRYQFLNFNAVNHLITAGCVLLFSIGAWFVIKRKAKLWTSILLLIALLLTSGSVYALKTAIDLSQKVTSKAEYAELELSVVVLADSPINDVNELTNISAPTQNDAENVTKLLEQIKKNEGAELTVDSVDSYVTAYQQLLSGEATAMVFNSAYKDFIAATDAEFTNKIKTIYTYKATQEIQVAKPNIENPDVFNVYISGIDAYGPVSTVSRSDVNIIMTVNRTTKTVLLTTTPRDAYVAIADGGNNQYDKLTHAGIYGTNASMHTLENLYGIELHYYMRLNFTSFTKLIDHLGGITVYNDQAFTSLHGNYDFPVGEVTMDSAKALSFVRERYSLAGGDNDRGKNQEKVIAAIIDKLTSVNALKNSNVILNDLGSSIQTNMDLETMNGLVNDQLGSNEKYTVISQALEGTGTMGLPSYAMPNANLYMMEINPASLDTMKAKMQEVMEGKAQ